MNTQHKTTNDRKKQDLAKYLCNCSVRDRENIIDRLKTARARNELRAAFHNEKAKQILTWPEDIRRSYLKKLARLNAQQCKAIEDALTILELDTARKADHAKNYITA